LKTFLEILNEKIVVFDGATGTSIQNLNLTPDDFGGEAFNGCNDYLVISKISAVEKVHSDFLEAGCDVVETNSFGASPIVLQEYGIADKAYELNLKAAQIARKVSLDFSSSSKLRFVAGSMGPSTKLPSLGHITFKEMMNAYYIQAKGLIEGGADLLVVETCQDVLQSKAALSGVFSCFNDLRKKIPVIVSITIESTSTMLLGTEISAALTSLEPYDVDVIGINCATGPAEMSEHIRFLSSNSPLPISCMPNAGLPENVGGKAVYKLSPDDFSKSLHHFVKDFGVNIVGGCCGTTKEHIKKLVEVTSKLSPIKREWKFISAVSSLYQIAPLHVEPAPVLVGERTNANGSKLFRELLLKNNWDGMVALAREQMNEGAHLLDLCVAYVGRNEVSDIEETVKRFNTQITVPLMIDSTDNTAIEVALQNYGGKAIVNSINLEDGEERFSKTMELCKKYGAAVIALTIDEEGMAKSAKRKLEIAKRIHTLAVKKYNLKEENLIFDPLTFTIASGDEELKNSGMETLEAICLIKNEFPSTKTSLGVSNISFGLKPASRVILNSVFLSYAVKYGLDMAIVHAAKILPLYKIDEKEKELCRKLIFNEKSESYDPLREFLNYFSSHKVEDKKNKTEKSKTIEERVKSNIIDGDKTTLEINLNEALLKYKPLDIINNILLEGMKIVGELFGSGEMQLPFVLQSAEVMKASVKFLEPLMDKTETTERGTLVLATVKGDVHDIGKNLVDIILSNNGYKVINLGIRVPIDTMLNAVRENNADAVGMSGLLVKSTAIMKENLEIMNERGITIPVILGGAALTRRFVEENLRSLYKGYVSYANDAFDGLHFMQKLKDGKLSSTLGETKAKTLTISVEKDSSQENISKIQKNFPTPSPPFFGSKVIEDVELDQVFQYINEIALIKGQWQIYKGKKTEDEYRKYIDDFVRPELKVLIEKVKQEKLLSPKVVYGYFPCQSDGNDLIVYKPTDISNPIFLWTNSDDDVASIKSNKRSLIEWVRFTFPRQKADRHLCISDYFADNKSGKFDVLPVQLVTIGSKASEYSQKLFSENKYKDYLFFHGISVETAEALAEYWHKIIRMELKIVSKDAVDKKALFAQGYQGSRYSFGYPACPDLKEQIKLFEILTPKRIGVEITDEFHLVPEQSTSAIVVYHPDAKYFTI
jgi:5-methyltetrahydrofolate--homocysteine methyltransferase